MKTKALVSLLTIACSAVVFAEPVGTGQLQIHPKNLARQHLGTNLFHYNPATKTYAPAEASAAWLDDDITTGAPILAGKQYYLIALPEAQLLSNFSLSARPAAGSLTLHASDEPAPPDAKSWRVLAKDVPLETVNEHKLPRPFNRVAKYLLVETSIEDPGPVFSFYLYGDKPATAYSLVKREQPLDTREFLGPFANDRTSLNVAGLYAQSTVRYASAPEGITDWQKVLDDNPESAVTLTASADTSGLTIRQSETRSVSRVAVLADAGARGALDFFVVGPDQGESPEASRSLRDLAPTVSIALDGSSSRKAVDFPAVNGSELLVRWTPANGTDTIRLQELNAFAEPTMATYSAAVRPEAVAEFGGEKLADASKDGKTVRDGKHFKDFKDLKGMLPPEPIGEFLPQRLPYLPGALGFPPNLTVLEPPTQPVSP